jgi:Transposase and inactivated derivatives
MNLKKIARIKKQYGLTTRIRKKNPYNVLLKKGLEHRTAPNLLQRKFDVNVPDTIYSTDISYLLYQGGQRAYLSATKDLATKEIVAFNVSKNLSMQTAFIGLENVLKHKDCSKLIIHSDQGVHYTHPLYVQKLKEFGATQSMSRKGNCLDNAPIESFFGHLKDDVDIKACRTFEEVKILVENYIDYYNNERCQWGLNKMTPAQRRCHLLNLS